MGFCQSLNKRHPKFEMADTRKAGEASALVNRKAVRVGNKINNRVPKTAGNGLSGRREEL